MESEERSPWNDGDDGDRAEARAHDADEDDRAAPDADRPATGEHLDPPAAGDGESSTDRDPGLPPEPDSDSEFHTALPPRVEAWRKRSATGAILTGLALGLQEALEKEREEPAIVMQTSGDPPKDLPVEADFEYRRPRHSVVNIRPWLVERSERSEQSNRSDQSDRSGQSNRFEQSEPAETKPEADDGTENP